MKRIDAMVFGLATALALSACSPTSNESSGGSTAPATSVSAGQASLVVDPGSVSACDAGIRVTAHVSWQVRLPSVKQVKVMVSDPDATTARLFSESGDTGSADTGNWVAAGTRFDLLDAATGSKLTSYVVKSEACKSP